jgi:hypothetical protein
VGRERLEEEPIVGVIHKNSRTTVAANPNVLSWGMTLLFKPVFDFACDYAAGETIDGVFDSYLVARHSVLAINFPIYPHGFPAGTETALGIIAFEGAAILLDSVLDRLECLVDVFDRDTELFTF